MDKLNQPIQKESKEEASPIKPYSIEGRNVPDALVERYKLFIYPIQEYEHKIDLKKPFDQVDTDAIEKDFKHRKNAEVLTGETKQAFYTALSQYPELLNANINVVEYKFKEEKDYSMESYPHVLTHLKHMSLNGKDRDYSLRMDSKKVDKLSLEEKTGLFMHELGHFLDYNSRDSIQMAKWVAAFMITPVFTRKFKIIPDFTLAPGFTEAYESQVDQNVLQRGGGLQILKYRKHIENLMKKGEGIYTQEYAEKYKNDYYSIQNLFTLMKQNFSDKYTEEQIKEAEMLTQ